MPMDPFVAQMLMILMRDGVLPVILWLRAELSGDHFTGDINDRAAVVAHLAKFGVDPDRKLSAEAEKRIAEYEAML